MVIYVISNNCSILQLDTYFMSPKKKILSLRVKIAFPLDASRKGEDNEESGHFNGNNGVEADNSLLRAFNCTCHRPPAFADPQPNSIFLPECLQPEAEVENFVVRLRA